MDVQVAMAMLELFRWWIPAAAPGNIRKYVNTSKARTDALFVVIVCAIAIISSIITVSFLRYLVRCSGFKCSNLSSSFLKKVGFKEGRTIDVIR